MGATIIKLIPDEEVTILSAYLNEGESSSLEHIFDELGVSDEIYDVSRCAVAVAQIILNKIQGELPNWASSDKDGEITISRQLHQRHADAKLSFNPKLLFTVNWADSGPGFSWPESYHITYLPSFNKYIVTSSRDGEDMYGCTDHAIGFAKGNLTEIEAAKQIIMSNWQSQINEWDQQRWAYLFDTALVSEDQACEWADEIWPSLEYESEDCDE